MSNSDTNAEELNEKFYFPIVLNKKTILLIGLFVNKIRIDLDANVPNSTRYTLELNIGINRTFNAVLSATYMAYPKIAADELKLSSEHLQAGFLSLFTKKKRAN